MSVKSTVEGIEIKQFQKAWSVNLDEYIHVLTWSPDGAFLLAAAANGKAMLVNGMSGEIACQWEAHTFGTLCAGWSRENQYFATGGQDGTIKIYDAKSAEQIATCQGGGTWVEHLAWSPHGSLLATASGKALRIWNPKGDLVHEFDPHENTIAGLAWHPKLVNQLATASYNGIRRFQVGSPKPLRRFNWLGSMLNLAWSPDAKVIACGCQDESVHVWYAKNGEDLEMDGYAVKPKELAWDKRPAASWQPAAARR